MPENHKITSAIVSFVVALVVVVCVVVAYQYGYKSALEVKVLSKTETLPLESHLALGVVEKVSEQEITLKDFKKVPIVSSSANQSERMVVTVNQSTTVERLTQKDLATVNKEREAFLKKTGTVIAPPETFTREKISLTDIKVGDTVAAFTNKNISKLDTFTATKIEVQKTAVKTPAPNAK